MKVFGKYMTGLLAAGLCLGAALFFSCENPLRAGLGPQVDIKDPTVELTSPKPGDFIYDEILFAGKAWDDIALAAVWIRLGEGTPWLRADLDKKSGLWSYRADTTVLIDGDLKIRLKVEDQYDRSTETADMVFVVKNGKPGVKITIPLIETYTSANAPVEFNKGDTGVNNPGDRGNIPPATGFENSRRQDSGGSLMGTVTDLRGIQKDGVKIKFWPVETYPGVGNVPPDESGAAGYNALYTWHDPVISEEDRQAGMTTVDFSFPYTIHQVDGNGKLLNTEAPLPANKYYRFQVKAVDMFGNVFIYPQDLYPQGAEPDNKYIEIYIRSADEEPKINLYLKELLNSSDQLIPLAARTGFDTAVIPRTYIEGRSSFVYGDFVLQMEASHSEGIGAAEFRITNEQGAAVSGYDWTGLWDSAYNGIQETDPGTFNPPNTVGGVKTISYYRKTFGTVNGKPGAAVLPDGQYTFYVRAYSASGTSVIREYDFFVDSAAPSIVLEGIKGALKTGDTAYTINGIVTPTVRISDGTGSKIRPADPAAPISYGPREQKWFIVDGSNKTVVDGLIGGNSRWYPNDDYTAEGFTVLQHKYLESDTIKIQSGVQGLADQGVYYLYIFARDNSFNVSHRVYTLTVDNNSDNPVYTFGYDGSRNSLGADAVGLIDPGVDNPNNGSPNSFLAADNTIRNRLNNTDTIRFRVSDDDSLNLGYTGFDSGNSSLKVSVTGTYVDGSGNIQNLTGIDSAYKVSLNDDQVKASFQANGSDLVTGRIGEISQDDLLTALKGYSGYTGGPYKLADSNAGLPDGIYFLEIEVSDLDVEAAKTTGTGDTLGSAPSGGAYTVPSLSPYTLAKATTVESFYIVVDMQDPVISIGSHAEGDYAAKTTPFNGTISDSNGPLTDASGGANEPGTPGGLTVTAEKKSRDAADFTPATADITVGAWTFTSDTADPLLFKNNWSVPITLNSSMDAFTGQIRLNFSGKDRFGRAGSRSVTLIVDNSPPDLRLSSVPRTVKRGAVSNYVNKVIEFTLSVKDDYPIEGLQWGIIPESEFASIENHSAQADLLVDYAALNGTPDTTHAYGAIDLAHGGYTVRVDTDDPSLPLTDGPYVLYAIAKDKAGNCSLLSGIKDSDGGSSGSKLPFRIHIQQDTDLPNFEVYTSSFKPKDGSVIGRSDLVVEGRITDDDGFNVDFTGPELPPVEIQYGYNNGTSKETAWIPLPKIDTDSSPVVLRANGATDVIFKLDLNNLAPGDPGYTELSAIGIGPDQLKWVKIKARDSESRKYRLPGSNSQVAYDDTLETGQVENMITLNFTLDTQSPIVALTLDGDPPNPVFGPGNETTFGVTVKVTEANLEIVTEGPDAGKGKIKYRLGGGADTEYLVPADKRTGDVWSFSIDGAQGKFYDPQNDGTYVLTITAADRSGKSSIGTISFTKDTVGPGTLITGTFPYPDKLPPPPLVEGTPGDPDGSLRYSWYIDPASIPMTDPQKQSWYAEQAQWLSEHQVPVITYKENAPPLKGSFTDALSPVKLGSSTGETFNYRFDGGSVWQTSIPLEGQGKSVNWTLPLWNLEDGLHSVSFKVSDTTGNENTPDQENWYVFRLDHRGPVLTVNEPSGKTYGSGASFTISGSAEDPNLKTVKLVFENVNGQEIRTVDLAEPDQFASFVTTTWTYHTDDSLSSPIDTNGARFDWAYEVDSILYEALGINTNTDGTCTVHITAEDYSGEGQKTEVVWDFVRDGTAPVVSVSGLSPAVGTEVDENPWAVSSQITAFNTANPQISGEAEDERTALGLLQTYIEYWDYSKPEANKWIEQASWTDITGSTNQPLVPGTTPAAAVNFTKYLGPSGAILPDGIYRVRFRAGDQALPPNSTGDTGAWYVFCIDRKFPTVATDPPAYTLPFSNNEAITGTAHKLTFTGTVKDENEIREVKAKFINYPAAGVAQATLGTGIYDSAEKVWTYTWKAELAAEYADTVANTPYTLEISAWDKGQTDPMVLTKGFVLDNKAPTGNVEVPAALSNNTSAELTAKTSLTGTVTEPNGVEFLGFYMSPKALNDDEAKALDDADFTRAGQFWQPNSVGLDESTDFSAWDGTLVVFNTAIYDWTLNIADIGVLTAPFIKGGAAYNYSNVLGNEWYDPVYGPVSTPIAQPVAGETGIFQINFFFRVRDRAGNTHHFSRIVKVNPRGDIPTVSIADPVPVTSANPRGGTIGVNGAAQDNQSIHSVIFRVIEFDNAGTNPVKAVYMREKQEAVEGLADWADALVAAASGDEADPYPAIQVGGGDSRRGWMVAYHNDAERLKNVAYATRINSGNEIDTTVVRRVFIEARSVDWNVSQSGPGKISAPVLREIWVTSGAPEITDLKVNSADLITSPPVRGDYTISALVKDTAGGTINKIEWFGQAKGETVEDWHDISSASSGSEGTVSGSGTETGGRYSEYTVTIPIESKKVKANAYGKSAGTYTITLRVTNNTGYNAEQSVTVNIDNFAPFRDDANYSNRNAAGTDYYVVGKVWDYDPAALSPDVWGVKQVVAWFTRGGDTNYEYLKEGTSSPPATDIITAVSGRTGPGVEETSGPITYPNTNGYKVILGPDSEYATDTNNDGYFPTNFAMGKDQHDQAEPGSWDWSFKLDTTVLADGILTLHYLVYDDAGNVSYYNQLITITNNPPAISEVVLGTDPRGNGSTDFNEVDALPPVGNDALTRHKIITGNWHNSDFKVWNNLVTFRVKPLNGRGNGQMHYRIYPATRTTIGTNELVVGEVYTIKTLGTAVPWDDLGAPSLRYEDGSTHFMAKAKTTAATTGEVYKYNVPDESLRKTADGPASAANYYDPVIFTYSGTDFGAGKINPTGADNDYWFIVKVWDTVRPYDEEADQLSDFVVIDLNVLGPETEEPAMRLYDLNPYTETAVIDSNADDTARQATLDEALDPVSFTQNIGRGGLYNTGTNTDLRRSGHIDPKNGTLAVLTAADKPGATYTSSAGYTNDQVSGKVILRGFASDNRRINEIRLKLGTGSALTILKANSAGVLEPQPGYSGRVVDTLTWDGGHRVEWALLWDSETMRNGNVIQNDLAVELIAADTSNNVSATSTAADDHSQITVDLKPYITGFKRDGTRLSGRSKQGWFSFGRGETNITVEGFNLTNTTTGVSFSVGSVASPTPTVSGSMPYTVKVDLAATANPGAIVYTPAPLNGTNDDAKSWNSFYHPNTPGSRLWQDNLNAHVWVTAQGTLGSDQTYMTNSGNAEYVAMAADSAGKLYGSFSVFSDTGVYYSDNRGTAREAIQNPGDPSRETDIAVDGATRPVKVVYNYLRDYRGSEDAGIYRVPDSNVNGTDYEGGGTAVETVGADTDNTARFMNPRISSNSTGDLNDANTKMNITYYDAQTNRLKYSREGGTGSHRVITLDGAGAATISSITASGNAGLWSAVDYTSDGRPIVAYYDVDNSRLRLMHNRTGTLTGNPSQTTVEGWTWLRQYVMDSTDPYYAKSGEYVSMKVQRDGSDMTKDIVHLSFYNGQYKTVVYARGVWDTTDGRWKFTATSVDNNLKAVAWTDISLDSSNNPWIVYGDSNRLGNKDGARIAYLNSTRFTRPSTDENAATQSNTGWEALPVPTGDYVIKNGRINIEAYPLATPPNWAAAVGYQSDMFRIAYLLKY
jgi:hypothetical protein